MLESYRESRPLYRNVEFGTVLMMWQLVEPVSRRLVEYTVLHDVESMFQGTPLQDELPALRKRYAEGLAFDGGDSDVDDVRRHVLGRNFDEGWSAAQLDMFLLGWLTRGVVRGHQRVGVFDVLRPHKDVLIRNQESMQRQRGLLYYGIVALLDQEKRGLVGSYRLDPVRKGLAAFGVPLNDL